MKVKNGIDDEMFHLIFNEGLISTHSFQRLGGIILGLLNAVGMCLDGHVTTGVVFPLFMKIENRFKNIH